MAPFSRSMMLDLNSLYVRPFFLYDIRASGGTTHGKTGEVVFCNRGRIYDAFDSFLLQDKGKPTRHKGAEAGTTGLILS